MNELAQYYKVLGLKTTATPEEVKRAYRSLVKQWHPDRFIDRPQLLEHAQQEIQKINQAYERLKSYKQNNNVISSSSNGNEGVVQTSKNAPEIHYQRGVEFAEAEEYEKAIAEFSLAIKIDKDYLNAYQYRSFILSKLGYDLRAESDFRTVNILKWQQQHPPRKKTNSYYYKSPRKYNKSWQRKQNVKQNIVNQTKWIVVLLLVVFAIIPLKDGKPIFLNIYDFIIENLFTKD